jgi:hypothetical protein
VRTFSIVLGSGTPEIRSISVSWILVICGSGMLDDAMYTNEEVSRLFKYCGKSEMRILGWSAAGMV